VGKNARKLKQKKKVVESGNHRKTPLKRNKNKFQHKQTFAKKIG
jgi:hypothetical protein